MVCTPTIQLRSDTRFDVPSSTIFVHFGEASSPFMAQYHGSHRFIPIHDVEGNLIGCKIAHVELCQGILRRLTIQKSIQCLSEDLDPCNTRLSEIIGWLLEDESGLYTIPEETLETLLNVAKEYDLTCDLSKIPLKYVTAPPDEEMLEPPLLCMREP